ncbi:ECF transporter S component [Brevibacillus fulvus]|uniref:Riboflavin transporter n=1 Tax=Brevibacillus fulvus TaxID=1125967 RepID=A0A938Y0K3_9BACL|nr:ECF transporter S component [Brevibacillus fulvus]MBM7589821.1 riboflavin transporter FmnP [Brevibacillus fulvus]
MRQTEIHVEQTMQTRKLVTIPLLAAVGVILQMLEFPLPVIPAFLKLDFSTLPGLIGGLVFGPVAGMMIELLKNALHMLLHNTDGLLVGEVANFVAGTIFIWSAVFLQRKGQGKSGFVLGLALGTVLMTIAMSVANVYFLMPAYAALSRLPLDQMLESMHIDSLWSLILYAIAPFNLIKGLALSLVAYPIYSKIAAKLRIGG